MDDRITKLLEQTIGPNNKSLYDHLCDIYYDIEYEKKHAYSDDMKNFEKLSSFLKKNGFNYKKPLSADDVNRSPVDDFPFKEYIAKVLGLFDSKPKEINTIIANFSYQNQVLQQAGLGFSEDEAHLIHQSIKRLVESQPANYFIQVRFWGKILAREKDYYVCEALLRKYYSEETSADSEQPGTGINEFAHYVTNDILGEWDMLPFISRKQMEVSRLIKCTFTGDLERNLNTYPPYPGKEKHLLKSQIVRITHANYIAPRGLYRVNEETRALEFEDEFKLPEFAELVTLESWVHVAPSVLKLGRITHWIDPSLNEELRTAAQEQLAAEDPEGERLRGIAEDKNANPYYQPGAEAAETGWMIKQFGDSQQYTQEDSSLVYSTAQLKNTLWPGACTVFNKNSWVNIYIGAGNKNIQPPFVPVSPNDLQDEPEDNDEFPEPNPQTLADELEPDSDDERKRLQEELELQQQNQ